jgi:hypothetical protein
MNYAMWKKVAAIVFIVGVGRVVFDPGPLSIGQELKLKGRLPPYFADIVTEAQRQRIYLIQSTYTKTRDDLEAQLEALKDKELAEIESVLTPPQKLALEKARAAAATKRLKAVVEANKAVADANKAVEVAAKAAEPAKKTDAKGRRPVKQPNPK